MATIKTDAELYSQVQAGIKVNSGQQITPPIHKSIEDNIIASKLSIRDGGLVVEALTGYTTELTLTDRKHFAYKGYVDDSITALGLSGYLKTDGSNQMLGDLDVGSNNIINVAGIYDLSVNAVINIDQRHLLYNNGTTIAAIWANNGSAGFGINSQVSLNRVAYLKNTSLTTNRTWEFPDSDGIFVGTTVSQTLTNKTLTSPVINVGSDATGDIYYRNAGGLFTRLAVGDDGDVLTLASGIPSWAAPAGSGGDVVGPSSATDNAIVRFDLTTGKLIQNSVITISDTGDIAGAVNAAFTGNISFSGTTITGLIANNLTTTQVGALSSVAGGIVFNTTSNVFMGRNNSGFVSFAWQSIGNSFTATNTFSGATVFNNDITFASAKGIKDNNSVYLLQFPSTVASAVNYFTLSNSATGNDVSFGVASGSSDTNVNVLYSVKGSGGVHRFNSSIAILDSTYKNALDIRSANILRLGGGFTSSGQIDLWPEVINVGGNNTTNVTITSTNSRFMTLNVPSGGAGGVVVLRNSNTAYTVDATTDTTLTARTNITNITNSGIKNYFLIDGTLSNSASGTTLHYIHVAPNITANSGNVYGLTMTIAEAAGRRNLNITGTADNYLAGNLSIGTTPISSAFLALAAGTTSKAQINFAASTVPSSPNDGDMWFDGTDVKIRVGGVTKTFTLV